MKSNGQIVSYSVALTKLHEIIGDALQRLVLKDGEVEKAYEEVTTRYEREIAKIK